MCLLHGDSHGMRILEAIIEANTPIAESSLAFRSGSQVDSRRDLGNLKRTAPHVTQGFFPNSP